MKSIRIKSDGTTVGTEIFDAETGKPIENITELTIKLGPKGEEGRYLAEVAVVFEGVAVEYEGPSEEATRRYLCGSSEVVEHSGGAVKFSSPLGGITLSPYFLDGTPRKAWDRVRLIPGTSAAVEKEKRQ